MREISPLLLACALGAGLSTACSDARHAPLAPVGGTVTYRGQPIKSGTMVFEVPGTRPANGKIVDGKIVEVTTYTPNDGVSLGKAAIAVFATRPAGTPAVTSKNPGDAIMVDKNYMSGGDSLIPARYNNPATSGLTAEINKGENTLTLELKE